MLNLKYNEYIIIFYIGILIIYLYHEPKKIIIKNIK